MHDAARTRARDRGRSGCRPLLLMLVLFLATVGTPPPARAGGGGLMASTASTRVTASLDLGRLPSSAEGGLGAATASATDRQFINRDGGVTAAYVNAAGKKKSLWIFGDTIVAGPGGVGQPRAMILGATAATSDAVRGRVPILQEQAVAGGTSPVGVFDLWPRDATFTCPSGTTGDTWERGAVTEPQAASKVLVANWGVCTSDPPFSAMPRRSGFAEIDTRTWRVTQHDVFGGPTARLSPQQIVGAPVITGGYLYSFSSACRASSATCTASGIYVSRARWNRASDWQHANRYRWWDGKHWVANSTHAVSVVRGARPFLYELDVTDITEIPGHRAHFAMTEQPDGSGDFRVLLQQ